MSLSDIDRNDRFSLYIPDCGHVDASVGGCDDGRRVLVRVEELITVGQFARFIGWVFST